VPLCCAHMPVATPAPKRTHKFEGKQGKILDAAATLFNQHGIKGTTLSDVAASVGLTAASVTYYYRKKEDLAAACFLSMLRGAGERVRAAAQEATLEARLHALFGQELRLFAAIELGETPEVMSFNDIRSLPSEHSAAVYAAYMDVWKGVRALLAGPLLAHLKREELNARTYLVASQLMRSRMCVRVHEPGAYAWVAEQMARVLLNGLAGKASVWPQGLILPAPRLLAQGDAQRDEFLKAATRLVNEQGYRGASISQISAELQLTKGAFYHHHENKDELITACFERSFAVQRCALEVVQATAGMSASGWERLVAAVHSLACFQLSEQGPLMRGRSEAALPGADRQILVQRASQQIIQRWSNIIVDGMLDGSLRVADPSTAAHMLNTLIDNVAGLPRWVHGVNSANIADLWLMPFLLGIGVDATATRARRSATP
jgi:AcrR family transcriptional regulator